MILKQSISTCSVDGVQLTFPKSTMLFLLEPYDNDNTVWWAAYVGKDSGNTIYEQVFYFPVSIASANCALDDMLETDIEKRLPVRRGLSKDTISEIQTNKRKVKV